MNFEFVLLFFCFRFLAFWNCVSKWLVPAPYRLWNLNLCFCVCYCFIYFSKLPGALSQNGVWPAPLYMLWKLHLRFYLLASSSIPAKLLVSVLYLCLCLSLKKRNQAFGCEVSLWYPGYLPFLASEMFPPFFQARGPGPVLDTHRACYVE